MLERLKSNVLAVPSPESNGIVTCSLCHIGNRMFLKVPAVQSILAVDGRRMHERDAVPAADSMPSLISAIAIVRDMNHGIARLRNTRQRDSVPEHLIFLDEDALPRRQGA